MADEREPVVFPNTFVDGWSGREVKHGYDGEPRIKCMSEGEFQRVQTPNPTNPIVVVANGFSRVNVPNPPTYPNGQQTFIQPGGPWQAAVAPGGFWPPRPRPPVGVFQPGVPNREPSWAEEAPIGASAPAPVAARAAPQPEPEPPRRRR